MKLLGDDALDRSSVVANCQMNRERTLSGSNGYSKELGFSPLELLIEKAHPKARWLDLCCGSGRALIEAAQIIHHQQLDTQIEIVGVDLVAPPCPSDPNLKCLRFIPASLAHWQPGEKFDLITCVHGLHYIGDKLGLIARAALWLTQDGRFLANLDLNNIRLIRGRPTNREIGRELRRAGIEYDGRKKLLNCPGRTAIRFPLRYLGADDEAGPNYTKQPAVDSYYEPLSDERSERA